MNTCAQLSLRSQHRPGSHSFCFTIAGTFRIFRRLRVGKLAGLLEFGKLCQFWLICRLVALHGLIRVESVSAEQIPSLSLFDRKHRMYRC